MAKTASVGKSKVNQEPRISVNKLGEYLTSNNPSRRRKILEEQKYPKKGFGPTRYKEARQAIIRYMISDYNEDIINDLIDELSKKTGHSEFVANDIKTSIEVLNKVLETDFPDFKDGKIGRYKGDNPKLNIENVSISIKPDVIIKDKNKNKKGAVKIHIIKTNTLSAEGQKYVSVLLHQFTEDNLLEDAYTANTNFSCSIDCFGKTHEMAPKSVFMRKSKIQDACREIASIWPSL